MNMCSPNKPKFGSSLCYTIPISVLLLVSPLIILSILDCTVVPWSGRVCLLGLDSFALAEKGGILKRTFNHLVEEVEAVLASLQATQSPPKKPSRRAIKKFSKLEKLEAALAKVRSSIWEAAKINSTKSVFEDPDYVPHGVIYRNANAFHRSYLEMEKLFKIYVYEEGEPPMFHYGPSVTIYSTEGRFIMELESWNHFRTKDPEQAVVYFLPLSVSKMVEYIYMDHDLNTYRAIPRIFGDYVHIISTKHSFWNRSHGANHFMLSCHDWAPFATDYIPIVFNNSIKVVCNANTTEGFNPAKDASLPEIYLRPPIPKIPRDLGGYPPSNWTFFAFYSGRVNGHIRYLLMENWKGKDKDILVYENVPQHMSYDFMMKNSRYCLCPSGYEVASPRIVEAIYFGCVPVLISDGYYPPFSDVLNWETFSVNMPVKDIPKLKKILMGIPHSKYLEMQSRIKDVRRHFVLNETPKRYDIFHMVIHSVWLRRLNVRVQD